MISVIIPAYNEESTIREVVLSVGQNLAAAGWESEIVVVDDSSTDATGDEAIAGGANLVLNTSERNWKGMWGAIRLGLLRVKGDIIVLFDADLELDPSDIGRLLVPILRGKAQVVYGNRFAAGSFRYLDTCSHRNGNRLLTIINALLTNRDLGDEACGFRAFTRKVADNLVLKENGFGGTHEFNARVAKAGYDICEVPVLYRPRSISQGKKIRLRHGIEAIWCMIKYNWLGR